MSKPVNLLRGLIVAHLVWTFLLTPLGLEPRPTAEITPLGWLSLALIFTTVGLDIVALVLVGRRPRTAALLAAIGPFLVVGPLIGDWLGLFSSIAPPLRIEVVEFVALLTQLAILYVAVRIRWAPVRI